MSKANRPRYCGTITKPTKGGCWIVRSKWRRGEKTIERDKQTFDSQQAAAEYAAELEQRHAPKKRECENACPCRAQKSLLRRAGGINGARYEPDSKLKG